MKLSLILEAIDRGADRALDRLRRTTRDLGRDTTRTGRDIDQSGRGMDRARRAASALDRAGRRIGSGIAAGARRGIHALSELGRRLQFSQAQMEAMAYRTGAMIGSTLRTGLLASTALAGIGLAATIHKVVSAGIQNETFETQLNNLESGKTQVARRDMEWIAKFAADTPFDLAQVTEAFINARMAGIDPMNGSLAKLGDAAAALNKTYDDAIGMLADARTEQYERMREFGITPNQKDGKVILKYVDRLGKEMVKSVNKSGAEVEKATLEILTEKFGGGGESLSKTTLGKWNALTDRMGQQAVKVWKSGFGDELGRQLDRMTQEFEKAEKSGAADHWSQSTGRALADVTKLIGDEVWTNGPGIIRDVGDAFSYLARAVDYLAKKRQELSAAMPQASILPPQFSTFSMLMANVRTIEEVQKRPPKRYPDVPLARRVPSSPLKREAAPRVPYISPKRATPLLPGQAPVKWPTALKKAASAEPQKAKISLHVTTDKGASVRPTKIETAGTDVEVNTGRPLRSVA